jgi:hypothetical protein
MEVEWLRTHRARPFRESAVGRCWSAARQPEASRIHRAPNGLIAFLGVSVFFLAPGKAVAARGRIRMSPLCWLHGRLQWATPLQTLVAAIAVARRDGAGCMICKCWEVRGAARPFWWARLIAWTRFPREGGFGVGGRLHVYLKLLYRVSAYKIGAKYWYQISVPSTCAEHRDLPIYYLLVS